MDAFKFAKTIAYQQKLQENYDPQWQHWHIRDALKLITFWFYSTFIYMNIYIISSMHGKNECERPFITCVLMNRIGWNNSHAVLTTDKLACHSLLAAHFPFHIQKAIREKESVFLGIFIVYREIRKANIPLNFFLTFFAKKWRRFKEIRG